MSPDNANAFGSMFGGMLATIFLVGAVVTVFFVWCFWRVFQRAGFNGALGLLCLIPTVGPLVCLLILAFSTWPIEQQSVPVHGGVPMA